VSRPEKISDEAILAGARRCFLAHGPSVATGVIAQTLGVSQGTLFNRFGNKQTLLIEALKPRLDADLMALLADGPDARPITEQLHEIGAAVEGHCAAHDPAVAMLRAAGLSRVDIFPAGAVSPMSQVRQNMTAWLTRAQSAGRVGQVSPAVVAELFLGALHRRPFDPPGDRLDRLEPVIAVLWKGLAPRSADPLPVDGASS
jgi:AcrR family transcriptional regulator